MFSDTDIKCKSDNELMLKPRWIWVRANPQDVLCPLPEPILHFKTPIQRTHLDTWVELPITPVVCFCSFVWPDHPEGALVRKDNAHQRRQTHYHRQISDIQYNISKMDHVLCKLYYCMRLLVKCLELWSDFYCDCSWEGVFVLVELVHYLHITQKARARLAVIGNDSNLSRQILNFQWKFVGRIAV